MFFGRFPRDKLNWYFWLKSLQKIKLHWMHFELFECNCTWFSFLFESSKSVFLHLAISGSYSVSSLFFYLGRHFASSFQSLMKKTSNLQLDFDICTRITISHYLKTFTIFAWIIISDSLCLFLRKSYATCMLSSLFVFNRKLLLLLAYGQWVFGHLELPQVQAASVSLVQFGNETLDYLPFSFFLTEWMSKLGGKKSHRIIEHSEF